MSRTFHSLILGLLLAVGTAGAQAQGDARMQRLQEELQQRFAKADANHDGLLSREEAQAGMPRVYQQYDAIDTGHSGALRLEDITRFIAQQRAGR
ncbi:EF-hand domain-containing protein [Ideonella sp. B7]|uniref:EF-hand domain-containing protein n=1 Tax=Ideonella benzenivorans TaxID=2831643 RepID=UPI001CEC8372|nr:EF-hand domain-containing protein [Ideonella benzenivorans]MCA6215877.1 EF-hand domain-containing protein [Ideonella benzenivorans]